MIKHNTIKVYVLERDADDIFGGFIPVAKVPRELMDDENVQRAVEVLGDKLMEMSDGS